MTTNSVSWLSLPSSKSFTIKCPLNDFQIEGARFVQELIQQPALRALNARPNPHRNPGCEKHELMSDEHLDCQARHHTLTIYHPVGTCAMGPPGDQRAVVDPKLRVSVNKCN